MKKIIKGKLFKIQNKVFNTKDINKIETSVKYSKESKYKEISSIEIIILFNSGEKDFKRYNPEEFKNFEKEFNKAFKIMSEYQKKIKK
jgi:hypothetical protein